MAEPTDISKAFAITLRHFRLKKGLSQEEFGMHRTYISLLENAGRSPKLDTMYALSQELEVPLSEMIQFAEEQIESGEI